MPRNSKPGSARIDLDVTAETKMRFAAIHEALGFKNINQTFEAIVFAVSTTDKIDLQAVERVERKLDHLLEHFQDFA